MLRGARNSVRAAVVALALVSLAGCSAGSASGSGGSNSAVEAASGATVAVQSVSPASGSLRGGTTVRVRGTGLDAVKSVRIGSTTVAAHAGNRTLSFTAPAATSYRAGAATVTLLAGRTAVGTAKYTYRAVDGVDRELQYALRYWKSYNPAYQKVDDNDCVDFTSQALLQRGWKQQGTWTHNADNVYASGAAWVSSTAFRDFMAAHPALGTALTDAQRAKVRVGDVVQFDWDGSGDRDHTGIVTRVVTKGGTTSVYFAGHTLDSDYRSVDTAITKDHPGGVAYYWSLK